MKVLTYTSYKKHFELYTEIHRLIADNSCQIKLARKDIILISKAAVILCKVDSIARIEDRHKINSISNLIILLIVLQ